MAKQQLDRTFWVLASNNNKFRLHDLLKSQDLVDWKQRNNINEGDIVFMYCTAPESRIRYMFLVVRTDLTRKVYINDDVYWIDQEQAKSGKVHNRYMRLKLIGKTAETDTRLTNSALKAKGLSASFQGGFKIAPGEILNYILGVFGEKEDNDSNLMPEEVSQAYYEGAQQTVTVNRYERDLRARLECIKTHGCRCAVCNLDFGELYGEIGKGFIHVHHIVPIHTIGEEYQLDPKTDLVPVCPNCHAMLHRGMKGEARSVEELKTMLGIDTPCEA